MGSKYVWLQFTNAAFVLAYFSNGATILFLRRKFQILVESLCEESLDEAEIPTLCGRICANHLLTTN